MRYRVVFLLSALLLELVAAETCDDLSYDVCKTFARDMDICSHPCLHSMCNRFCGKCATLKCYDCHQTYSPETCNQTVICPTDDHYCITTESFDDNFRRIIKLGCATKNICATTFGFTDKPIPVTTKMTTAMPMTTESTTAMPMTTGPTTAMPMAAESTTAMPMTTGPTTAMPMTTEPTTATPMPPESTTKYKTDKMTTTPFESTTTPFVVGRRAAEQQKSKRAGLDGECCATDMCNNHVPGTQPSVQPMLSQVVSPSSTGNGNCYDVSQDGCQLLAKLKTAMCTDPCIASACPRTCGKCSECYSCAHVTRPEDCNQTTVCLGGEKCYALETLNQDGEHGFKVGCMHEQICTRFHSQAGQIFGRRSDPVELSLHGDCCSGDLCNHKEITPVAATTVKPIGCHLGVNHCPDGFHLIDGKCFLIGAEQKKFDQAQQYCERHCANLTEQLSSTNIKAIVNFLMGDFNIFNRPSYLYIGAIDVHHNGYFTWLSTGQPVSSGRPHVFRGKYCATINVQTYGMHPVSCVEDHRPLCQAPKR